MGAAAVAKIPLTDRRFASKLVFASYHSGADVSAVWDDVISKDATLVVHMPGGSYAEIASKLSEGGLGARTPCLIVSQASQAGQQIHPTTLRELSRQSIVPAPVLLIVGEVARPLPPLEDSSKASARTAAKPHEEVLHLTDTPVQAR